MKSAKESRPRVILVNRVLLKNSKEEILLIRRSENDAWKPGEWELPGGKLDQGQDIANALEREVFEETGLVIVPLSRVVYYESYIVDKGKYKGLPYICMIGTANIMGKEEVKLSEEHDGFIWVDLRKKPPEPMTQETRKAINVLESSVLDKP